MGRLVINHFQSFKLGHGCTLLLVSLDYLDASKKGAG